MRLEHQTCTGVSKWDLRQHHQEERLGYRQVSIPAEPARAQPGGHQGGGEEEARCGQTAEKS